MLPKELLKNIRRIEITASKAVNDVFAGRYKSAFKGRGMEFEEVREYQPGDDIRSIDWNVTARVGAPFIKKHREERELTVMLMVDVSRSMYTGSGSATKKRTAAEIAAVLAFSAIRNNDKVGLIMFGEKVEAFVPPAKGRRHVLRIIRDVLFTDAMSHGTDIAGALEHLNRIQRKRAVVFVVSDFFGKDFSKVLAVTQRRHDVVAVTVRDAWEKALSAGGLVAFEDAEAGVPFLVDTDDARSREAFAAAATKERERLKRMFAQAGAGHIEIKDRAKYIDDLTAYFSARQARQH